MADGVPDLTWRPATGDPTRYAAVSHDSSGVHLDEEVARAEGLPGVILHGMHVLGHVVSHLDRNAPAGQRLASVSVRFLDVTVPEEDVAVHFSQEASSSVTFDGVQSGRRVVGRGSADFRPL